MKVKRCYFILLCLFWWSCDNTLDLNARYKEIPVVYGLLNISDTAHYIKVNKAFLGEGNVYSFANNPDSQYFHYPIKVVVEERNAAATLLRSLICDSVVLPKDSGLFSSQGNKLYQLPKGTTLSPKNTYKLVVTNKLNGAMLASATTSIVEAFRFNPYAPSAASYYNAKTAQYNNVKIGYFSPANGYLAELLVEVSYKEYSIANGSSVNKSFSFIAESNIQLNGTANNEESISFSGRAFFEAVLRNVKKDETVYREMDPDVKYKFSFAGKDLTNAINTSRPILSLSDLRPSFSNVEGGIGVFSSRFCKESSAYLTSNTLDFLKSGPDTKALNFQ